MGFPVQARGLSVRNIVATSTIALLGTVSPAAFADEEIESILVLGSPLERGEYIAVDPRIPGSFAPDSAALLGRVPGGNVINNGGISGQVQYRGLFGPRLSVSVDGQVIAPGGPNWMDPPLHYAPKALLDTLEVQRGISSVSLGPGIGGTVQAKLKSSAFTDSENFKLSGSVVADGHTIDDGFGGGGIVSAANHHHRFHVLGTYEEGDDFDFAGGTVLASEYGRWAVGGGYGLQVGKSILSLSYRHHETAPTGNPPFPLDIAFFNSDFFKGEFSTEVNDAKLTLRVNYADIEHQMDNFSTRPLPAGTARIETPASSDTLGFLAKIEHPLWGGDVRIGVDGYRTENNATVTQPDNAGFVIGTFKRAENNRTGAFIEWAGNVSPKDEIEIGVRYDRVNTDADDAFFGASPPVPPPVVGLVGAFNASDRSREDNNVDAVAKYKHSANRSLSFSIGGARKQRSPSYIERYAFLPIEVTAGFADGNNTIGDVTLRPETAYIADVGVDWNGKKTYVTLRGFYNRIDDYIQSVPFDDTPTTLETGIDPNTAILSPLTPAGAAAYFAQFDGAGGVAPNSPVEIVSLVNGDATPLRFANVDAMLFGVDMAFGAELSDDLFNTGGQLLFDSIVTFVRGKRRDIDDDLYRITPARSVVTLAYEKSSWRIAAEGVLVAGQSNVSATNGELPTGGYQLLNFYAEWRPTDELRIAAGVENVTNAFYQQDLAGYNRIGGSDVSLFRPNPFAALDPSGRIPGSGVGGFLQVGYRF